jgi:hypothetical protein
MANDYDPFEHDDKMEWVDKHHGEDTPADADEPDTRPVDAHGFRPGDRVTICMDLLHEREESGVYGAPVVNDPNCVWVYPDSFRGRPLKSLRAYVRRAEAGEPNTRPRCSHTRLVKDRCPVCGPLDDDNRPVTDGDKAAPDAAATIRGEPSCCDRTREDELEALARLRWVLWDADPESIRIARDDPGMNADWQTIRAAIRRKDGDTGD